MPVPPLPPVAVLKKCSSRNHHKCFTKCLEQDSWQAHSVEELVVWIVASEKDCSFEQYAKTLDLPKGWLVGWSLSSVWGGRGEGGGLLSLYSVEGVTAAFFSLFVGLHSCLSLTGLSLFLRGRQNTALY